MRRILLAVAVFIAFLATAVATLYARNITNYL